jgi:hypothetical protein
VTQGLLPVGSIANVAHRLFFVFKKLQIAGVSSVL